PRRGGGGGSTGAAPAPTSAHGGSRRGAGTPAGRPGGCSGRAGRGGRRRSRRSSSRGRRGPSRDLLEGAGEGDVPCAAGGGAGGLGAGPAAGSDRVLDGGAGGEEASEALEAVGLGATVRLGPGVQGRVDALGGRVQGGERVGTVLALGGGAHDPPLLAGGVRPGVAGPFAGDGDGVRNDAGELVERGAVVPALGGGVMDGEDRGVAVGAHGSALQVQVGLVVEVGLGRGGPALGLAVELLRPRVVGEEVGLVGEGVRDLVHAGRLAPLNSGSQGGLNRLFESGRGAALVEELGDAGAADTEEAGDVGGAVAGGIEADHEVSSGARGGLLGGCSLDSGGTGGADVLAELTRGREDDESETRVVDAGVGGGELLEDHGAGLVERAEVGDGSTCLVEGEVHPLGRATGLNSDLVRHALGSWGFIRGSIGEPPSPLHGG